MSDHLPQQIQTRSFRSLRTAIALTFAVSTLVLAGLLSLLVGEITRREIRQDTGSQMRETAQQLADKLDRGMFERYRDIQNAATLLRIGQPTYSAGEKRALIETLQQTFPDYSWIGLTDTDGTVLVSTGRVLEGEGVSARPWFVNGLEGSFVGDVHDALLLASLLPAGDGEPLRLVDIAAPVTNDEGVVQGVLGAHLNWEWARELHDSLLASTASTEQIGLFILDQDGDILLGPDGDEGPLPAPVTAQIDADTAGTLLATWPDGTSYLTGIAPTTGHRAYPGLGWVILTRQPATVAFAPARQLSLQILGLGAVLGLAFAGVGWLLAGRIARPLETLAAAARRLRPEDTAAALPRFGGYGEIASLSTSLRTMVTTLQTAQEERRQAEAERDRLFDLSLDMLCVAGTDGYFKRLNPAFETALGYTRDELLARPFLEFVHPDDRPESRAELEKLAAGEPTTQFRNRFRCHDGTYKWLEWNVTPANGRLYAVARDITDRKQMEEALRESEGRYRSLAESSGVGIWQITSTGHTRYINPAMCSLLGIDHPDELAGETYHSFFTPESLEIMAQHHARRSEGVASSYEVEIVRADGQRRTVIVYGAPVLAADGRVHSLIGTFVDITERKRAEAARRRSESNLKAILNNSLQSFILLDREGRIQARNEVADERARVILGRSMEPGQRFVAYINPMGPGEFPSHFRQALQGKTITTERQLTAPNGMTYWFETNYTPVVEEDGTVTGVVLSNLDVTERKQAEQSLRQEKAFTDAIIDSLPGAFFLFNAGGQFLRWNENMVRVTGYTAEEIPHIRPVAMVAADERDLIAAKIQETFTEGKATVEAHLLTKDGRTLPYLFTARRITLGEMPTVVGLGLDISDRKQAEERLRRSEANLRAIFNNTLQAFVLFGPDRRVMAQNRVADKWAQQILGQPLQEGERADRLFAHFNYENFQRVFARALQGETVTQQRRVTVGEQGFWFETNYIPAITEDGAVIGVSLSVLNITARKQAEIALRRQAQQVQHIIETVPEGVLLLGANGAVELANPIAREYLALLAPEWDNGPLTHLGQRSLDGLLTASAKGLGHEVAVDDQYFRIVIRPVAGDAREREWVLMIRDVTQERDVQRRIQRQERLAAVGQMAAGIAHDFNNIMAVVMLHTQLVLRTVDLPGRAQEKLLTIERQAERASDLIQQILDFSRQSMLTKRPLDLVPFLEELTQLLSRTLPESIQIELNYAGGEYVIDADPSRMQQVMMNLAVNARDVMPDGGQLTITLSRRQLTKDEPPPVAEMSPGAWVQIQVADGGNGIPADDLDHIFEPFFTTKEVGQGTGLGLAQVYGIVQQHGGYIDVETEIGRGTTFCLYFPALTAGEVALAEAQKATFPKGQGRRVLVVEDDPATRQALVESLTFLNYETVEAGNGREGLDLLRARTDEIDLVLSDVIMPEMDGVALLQALRQQGMDIPVVMITGHPLSEEMETLQGEGLNGWLPKPPELSELANLLARALAD